MSVDIATSSIVSQAFRAMEVAGPSSFGDDSEEARAAEEQYTIARDMVLELYDWSEARRIAALPPLTSEDTDPSLPYACKLPADALRLRHVHDGAAFRVDGRMIRTDRAEGLTIRFTARIDRETDLTATLQTAIALQLAVLLSARFVGSRTKRADLRADLSEAIRAAIDSDAHSASSDGLHGDLAADWPQEALR